MKTIYIEDEITEYIDLDSLKINSNQIINKIKQLNILENKKSYKSIFYNIQTDDIIIRNIENINISNKKDIKGIIKYNINQYMSINLEEYEMRYKIINKKGHIATIQTILFPKYLINLCKLISKDLGIKMQSINANFDILQKLIYKNMINNIKENSVFLDIRKNEFIINKVKNNIVIESYIIPINDYLKNYINKLQSLETNLYFYGQQNFEYKSINKILLNSGNKTIKICDKLDQDISKYINSIGIVI